MISKTLKVIIQQPAHALGGNLNLILHVFEKTTCAYCIVYIHVTTTEHTITQQSGQNIHYYYNGHLLIMIAVIIIFVDYV